MFLDRSLHEYTNQIYTELLEVDLQINHTTYTICLSLRAVNQSCAAVSYDGFTSTCKMSGKPSVIDNSTDTQKTTSVKQAYSSITPVYEFSTLLARGIVNKINVDTVRRSISSYKFQVKKISYFLL